MAELRERVAQANTRTASAFATLGDSQRRVAAQLDRVIVQLGRVADAKERATDSGMRARVLDAVRDRRFDTLSIREQRYAAKQFTDIAPAAMQQFLAAAPRNWPAFASECLRRWDDFGTVNDRSAYTRLLCLAPNTMGFLHRPLRPQELVASDGPARLAGALRVNGLIEARDTLQQWGFDSTWGFTSNSVASWLHHNHDKANAFSLAWQALVQDRVLEAMLLPPMSGKPISWFTAENRPARVQRSIEAQATAIAGLIRAAYATGAYDAHWGALTEGLLHSTFGDPRIPPDSEGWLRLKRRDEPAYQRFLEQLITEDLSVFFDHAMEDPRRKAFWLRYLKSVRRTVCILDRATHARLKTQLAGANEKLGAAISRARQFRGSRSGAQAFCLYFDSFVVVEFSTQGNAAYVYDRATFEKNFERVVYADACPNHNALKSQRLAHDRILHMGDSWERATRDVLLRLGIYQDRR